MFTVAFLNVEDEEASLRYVYRNPFPGFSVVMPFVAKLSVSL